MINERTSLLNLEGKRSNRLRWLYLVLGAVISTFLYYALFILPALPEAQSVEPFTKMRALERLPSSRLILIGDVHGKYHELQKLLKAANHKPKDTVVLLGDFITKGPDSLRVLDWAAKNQIHCILGNHEWAVLQLYVEFHRMGALEFTANEETYQADASGLDIQVAKRLQPHHVRYLNRCPLMLSFPLQAGGEYSDGVPLSGLAVHAGLNPAVPAEAQLPWDAMNVRDLAPPHYNETSAEPLSEGKGWAEVYNHLEKARPSRTIVYYGHDAHRGLSLGRYTKGLDLGCAKGEELSAMVVGGGKHYKERVYQVKC